MVITAWVFEVFHRQEEFLVGARQLEDSLDEDTISLTRSSVLFEEVTC
jgi:hypothetical protein